ncbi:uncharacterized protein [Eurosta solidaginis]|uniref:uncharacterized protein n=1 Tax=Eurosta solidaginis TaxID=178769 RepID=UPI003530C68E
MEILMKLKCSPSTPSHGNNSTTLKVVDHHHQLTQQHAALPPQPPSASATAPTAPPSLVRLPTQTNQNYNSSSTMPSMALHAMPRLPTTARPCMNYTKPMECCNAVVNQQEVELYDLQWREQQGRRGVTYEVTMQRPPPPNCCANISDGNLYEAPTSCCSSACQLPGCGATPPMAALPPALPPAQTQPPPLLHQTPPALQPPPLAYPMTSAEDTYDSSGIPADYNTHYEYQEPEENFVSIEDSNIKSLLMKIGREYAEEKKQKEHAAAIERRKRRVDNVRVMQKNQPVVFEIIELDDEDDRQRVQQRNRDEAENIQKTIDEQRTLEHDGLKIMKAPAGGCGKPKNTRMKSPSISLIPKSPSPKPAYEPIPPQQQEKKKERIIAHIELSDSSDAEVEQSAEKSSNYKNQSQAIVLGSATDDVDDDSEEMVYAAAAVSCELECVDDDNVGVVGNSNMTRSNADNDVVILNSDDENSEYIVPHGKAVERHWDDSERREKCRQFFECYLCGKKVQSSYNLRRHMMIHTGERPFACDMCDRRFREFSDLKKHRRRHANEPNFVCMVCRVKTPTLYDPTRCNDCDSKASALIASMPPQHTASPATSTPDKIQTPPMAAGTARQTPPAQLTTKPILVTSVRDMNVTMVKTTLSENTTKNNNNRMGTLSSPAPFIQQSTVKSNASPKRPPSSNTTLQSTDMPSLVPINSTITVNKTVNKNTQLLLDNVPALQRSNYAQSLGIIARKEFACTLCQRAFGTRHNLKRHFMIHTGEKPFSCDKCRKPFREYSTLKKHMVTHQRERYYKCSRCPRQYSDYLEYCEHKKIHANEDDDGNQNEYADADDDDDDDDEGNFDQQRLSSSSSTSSPQKRAKIHYDSSGEDNSSMEDCFLECCECKQRYTDIESYTKHLKEHDPNAYVYECYICKKTFEKRDELVEHVSACKEELRETALSQRAKCFN